MQEVSSVRWTDKYVQHARGFHKEDVVVLIN